MTTAERVKPLDAPTNEIRFVPEVEKRKVEGKVVVVIAALNEERFVGSVVLKAREYADVVIVVNDGSSDDTSIIARSAGAVVVDHEINKGKGVALNTGFKKAKEFEPAVVITLDGDWQHMPEELPVVMAPVLSGDADIVIGSRYLEKTSDVPLQRVLGHQGFNLLINTVSGTSLTDSQSGFRAFSRRAIDVFNFASKGFSVESEMQFLAKDLRLRVLEVPITIRYVDKPKRPVLAHGMRVLSGILKLIGQTRPLLFFSVPGLLMTLLGSVVALSVIETYWKIHELALGTALLALTLCFIGVLSMFTGLILHSLRGLIFDFVHRGSSL